MIKVPYMDNLQKVVETPECFDWDLDKQFLKDLKKKKGARGELKNDPTTRDCSDISTEKTGWTNERLIRECNKFGNEKCRWHRREKKCIDEIPVSSCGGVLDEQVCIDNAYRGCVW